MKKVCQTLGVSRSNLHEQLTKGVPSQKRRSPDQEVLPLIRELTDERPTYGYRRITALLRKRVNKPVNAKRVYRIMRTQGLLLQRHGKRPTRVHDGKVITLKSNLRWCSDHFSLVCWNAEQVHVAFVLDCHDREIISWVASNKGVDGQMIRELMAMSVEERFGAVASLPHKLQWLSDNGPAYVARQTVAFGRLLGFEMCTTAPYSPESNGMAEAFVKTFKRDYAYIADLSSAQQVIEQLPNWFEDYNTHAPHKGLKMLSPREYRRSSLEDLKQVKCNLMG
jgi:transposase InsO family protein